MIYIAKFEKRVPMSRILNCPFTTTSPSASEIYTFLASVKVLIWLIYTKNAETRRHIPLCPRNVKEAGERSPLTLTC